LEEEQDIYYYFVYLSVSDKLMCKDVYAFRRTAGRDAGGAER